MDPSQFATSNRGKVAVVTGAGRGIGRAIAIALANTGATLALIDVDVEALEPTNNPPNSEEAQIVTDLKSLLAEIDVGGLHYDRNHSLAAMLAQVWASFLDDTWEWGVTRRIWARSSGY
ncbi:hypothetical protein KXW94_003191 [Aspergillus fumigatus]|nr:hypothetical protein KXW94_003191 [Aspergillus fumigatus]